ncbi:phosphoribosylformylglycinamidine synthase subunit PurS, partial [Chlamydiota bacterium]
MMKKWRIEVIDKNEKHDPEGTSICKGAIDLGITGVDHVRTIKVFELFGAVAEKDIQIIAESLLSDPITEDFSYTAPLPTSHHAHATIIEVIHNPGVTDPVEASVIKAIRDIGINGLEAVRTAKKYIIEGNITKHEIKRMSEKLLYNKVIQHIVNSSKAQTDIDDSPDYYFNLVTVDILNASKDRLLEISRQGQLSLTLNEMETIKQYFSGLNRNPTDCELEILAQTWSEHCKHKTLRGLIEFNKTTIIDNLLKNTIMKVTKDLNKPWCVSVFHDNAGIISFDEEFNICFKVETHNHPSALEPYGGAGTGLGGVIRDILGTGRGAKPILNTDVFCFGNLDSTHSDLPPGTLHPKRVMKGVVSGVRDYGNRMGIPTANGAVLFHENYLGNPLVYCGTVGLIPKNRSTKKVDPGDFIVVVGGRTGRDGIHGATFSSIELTHESESISSQAVQIGNPIIEKKVTDTLLQAQALDLYKAITDCGAGGLSSAVGEMGEETGARVELEKIPLKYHGLSYWEMWISEAQERMVLAVSPQHIDELLDVFKKEDVEATVIGSFTDDNRLTLYYSNNLVCDMDMDFIHNGLPKIKRKALWTEKLFQEPIISEPKDYGKALCS